MKKEINKINFMELNAYKMREKTINFYREKLRIEYSHSKYFKMTIFMRRSMTGLNCRPSTDCYSNRLTLLPTELIEHANQCQITDLVYRL